MKRISVSILLMITVAVGLNAQGQKYSKGSKFDHKLQDKLNRGKDSDKVRVIIQSHDLASLPARLAKAQGRIVEGFVTFPGVVVELPLGQLKKLSADPTIYAISSDEPLGSDATLSGLEPPNSSSGALDALQRFGAAGAGVGVAIIDSGIARVAALPNVVYSLDFTGTQPANTDVYGHGTHVAGIVGNSGEGPGKMYAGVAPSARLIDLRVLDGTGTGSTSSVIAAIDWAIVNRNINGFDGKPLNIRVLNLSLGHVPLEGAETDPLAVECRRAVLSGLVVVVAAGNSGKDANGNTVYGTILTPGIEPSVITVGAVTTWGTPSRADDVVASYSSRGPTLDGLLKPDVVAPGSRIVSTMAPDSNLITNNPDLQVDSNYMLLSGTSMAAPEVSGTVAMMLSKLPSLTPNAVKAILMWTAEQRGNPLDWGAGYINDVGAMEMVNNINPNASVNANWLKWNAIMPAYDLINGYPVSWGQTIVWGDTKFGGNSIKFNKGAWGQTIVWGDTIVWEDTVVWGETIIWEVDALTASSQVTGQTIVWDTVSALTVIWGDSSDDVAAQ
jgi:serine protease AprX